jgi:type IV secretory pathway VirB9-like protein
MWLLLLLLITLAGCTGLETYPPAVPALPAWSTSGQASRSSWEKPVPLACYLEGPLFAQGPAVPLTRVRLPSQEEWRQWREAPPEKRVCRGKGKRRTCSLVRLDPIDQANAGALVRATASQTNQGQSAQVRYPYDAQSAKVFQIVTSPQEVTYLLLPPGERLAIKMLLNPEQWEVSYGKNGAEGSRSEVIAVRPTAAPQSARTLLALQSGATLHLALVAQDRLGMLSVTWDVPTPTAAPVPTPDKIPPQFIAAQAYEGYSLQIEGKGIPPWMPEGVLDDGRNTLIKLPGLLEGIRPPVVNGIQQNGKPALVASRLYIRPGHGAWLYVQGLHPALDLVDAAEMRVRIVRQPPSQEQTRVY